MSAKKAKKANKRSSLIFDYYSVEEFKKVIFRHVLGIQGRDPERASNDDMYRALSYSLRDVLIERWIQTQKDYYAKKQKRV
ncbi:MAG: hypothetical protein KAI90_04075, partial [Desulfobulbaceae bacterium]|nr:hypothetical protein [Desulfobulbaceae bacterium]